MYTCTSKQLSAKKLRRSCPNTPSKNLLKGMMWRLLDVLDVNKLTSSTSHRYVQNLCLITNGEKDLHVWCSSTVPLLCGRKAGVCGTLYSTVQPPYINTGILSEYVKPHPYTRLGFELSWHCMKCAYSILTCIQEYLLVIAYNMAINAGLINQTNEKGGVT